MSWPDAVPLPAQEMVWQDRAGDPSRVGASRQRPFKPSIVVGLTPLILVLRPTVTLLLVMWFLSTLEKAWVIGLLCVAL